MEVIVKALAVTEPQLVLLCWEPIPRGARPWHGERQCENQTEVGLEKERETKQDREKQQEHMANLLGTAKKSKVHQLPNMGK